MPALSNKDLRRLKSLGLPGQIEAVVAKIWRENEYECDAMAFKYPFHPAFYFAMLGVPVWAILFPETPSITIAVKFVGWAFVAVMAFFAVGIATTSLMRKGFDDEFDEVGKVQKILLSRGALEIWKRPGILPFVLNVAVSAAIFFAGSEIVATLVSVTISISWLAIARLRKRVRDCVEDLYVTLVVPERYARTNKPSGNVYEGEFCKVP